MIAYWVVAGFFTAFGWHYGEKLIVTYIDKPEPKIEQTTKQLCCRIEEIK